MTTGEELLAAIEANPGDRDALAVYSDWLIENDEPLGEIIARALNDELEPDLTEAHEVELFHHFDESWKAEWDPMTGFVRSLEIETEAGGDLVRALAREPALRLLYKLELGAHINEDAPESTDPIVALATAPFPRSLRALTFWMEHGIDDEEVSRDYMELFPHIPFVEELALESPLSLRAMNLPRLRSLRLNAPLYHAFIDDLGRADLPALETLEIQDEYWRYQGFNPPFPKLDRFRYIRFPSTLENARELFGQLAISALVRRVGVLDLSLTVDASNVAILAEHAAALRHLRELHVGTSCEALDRALGSRVRVTKE